MAKNTATLQAIGTDAFMVRVNKENVFQFGDKERAQLMVERLNRIFQDVDRDLDFLTPTILQRGEKRGELFYALVCPPVRRNQGVTHFHPLGKRAPLDRHIYPVTEWIDSTEPAKQTAIMELHAYDAPAPWVTALQIANRIRRGIELNFPDASGKRKHPSRCYPLNMPSNQADTVENVIAEKAYCAVYAHPCQGKGGGPRSPKCDQLAFPPENILNPYTEFTEAEDRFEILHSSDLTCALTSSRGWYNKYKNRFIRVTNLANGLSVVVRVTDRGPRGQGVELTYAAWNAIGKPKQYDSVKVELMGS